MLHFTPPLSGSFFHIILTITARSTIIDLQHCIATRGEKLHLGIKAPAVAHPKGSTMWIDDHRHRLAGLSGPRSREVTVDGKSVTRDKLDGLHRPHQRGRHFAHAFKLNQ